MDCAKLAGQALNTISRERAEWLLWLDMDMVLENITFTLPLDSYAGKDFILWGQPEWIMKGHNAKGAGSPHVIILAGPSMFLMWSDTQPACHVKGLVFSFCLPSPSLPSLFAFPIL